jgi:hypothetical protein
LCPVKPWPRKAPSPSFTLARSIPQVVVSVATLVAATTVGPAKLTDEVRIALPADSPARQDTANPVRAQAVLRHQIAWKRKTAKPSNAKDQDHLARTARIAPALIVPAPVVPDPVVLPRIVLTRIVQRSGTRIAAWFAQKVEISPPFPIVLPDPAGLRALAGLRFSAAPAIHTSPKPSKNHFARIAIVVPAELPAAVPAEAHGR